MSDPATGQHPHRTDAGRIIVVIIGAMFILIGLVLLVRQWFWPYLPLEQIWKIVRGAGWGLGLVIIGIVAIVWSQRPGFRAPERGTRIYRSRGVRMVSGVFGGLADYLAVDVTLLRLAYVALALMFGVWPAIIAYIAATVIVPEAPVSGVAGAPPAPPASAPPASAPEPPAPEPSAPAAPPAPEPPAAPGDVS